MGGMAPQTTQRQFAATGALHQAHETATAPFGDTGENAPIAAEGGILLITNPRCFKPLSAATDQQSQQAGQETAQPQHRWGSVVETGAVVRIGSLGVRGWSIR